MKTFEISKTQPNHKKVQTLRQLENDERVSSVSDERGNGDGIWIYLTDQYRDFFFDPWNPMSSIHEQTVRDLLESFNGSVRKVK